MPPIEAGVERTARPPSLASALLAFLVCPALVAGVIPLGLLTLDPPGRAVRWWGAALIVPAVVALLACVRDFYRVGKGTLAPWAPPSRLVVVGLYRYTRNPMYLAVLGIVGGIALLRGSPRLLAYLVVLAFAFEARVRLAEEPRLAQAFGPAWRAYRDGVRRWWPRRKPWTPVDAQKPG